MDNQNKLGYKNTPLGWIPEEWEVKKLGDIGELKNGINKDKEEFGHGFPLVNLMDIFGISRVYNISSRLGLVNSNEREREDYSLKKGDVLFVRSSVKPEGVGLTSLVCESIDNATYSGFLIRFRDGDYLEFEYKAHCFFEEKFRKQLLNKSTISANTNINQGALNSLLIPVPLRNEQNKIATILSTWDEAITKTQQLIAQLQQRNKGLMQQLLTGKKRLKGFEKKWKLKLLSDCLNYTPREVPKPSSNFLALGIRSHGKGIFHKNDFDPAVIAMEALYEVKENDLIVNITFAWEQAIAIAGKEDEDGLVSHRFPTYTFKTESAIPAYFKFLIIQKNFKYMLDLISPGGAGRNRVMSKNNFLKLEIQIPDVNEQKVIADILNSALNEVKLNQEKLSILQRQKKGLMQKLLTGEIRVKIDN